VTRFGYFLLIWSLLEVHFVFEKDEVAQMNGIILGYFSLTNVFTFSPKLAVSKHDLL
jgi:hypothetical protein